MNNDNQHDNATHTLQAATQLAIFLLKALITTNGAAALALLTITSNSPYSTCTLRPALLAFGIGTAFALLTAMLGYLSQLSFHQHLIHEWKNGDTFGDNFRAVAIGTAIISFATFCIGIYYGTLSMPAPSFLPALCP